MAFTLDTYAHVMPNIQPEGAELFMELVYDDEPDETATATTRRDSQGEGEGEAG